MIDATTLKGLNKLHPRSKRPACFSDGKISTVHSPYFVLELPDAQVAIDDWPHEAYDGARRWRAEKIPADDAGSVAQVMRATWEGETDAVGNVLEEVVQLVADDAERFMTVPFYEFFTEQIADVSFRLYKADMSNIGIFDGGTLVGVITPLIKGRTVEAEEGEDE